MKPLDKQDSRKRWAELQALWNDYDPIGVMDDPEWPRDEYDSYVGPMMRLLEKAAPQEQIVDYLESVSDHMGMAFHRDSATMFAVHAKQWFERAWPETSV